jgi:hypothetical protein
VVGNRTSVGLDVHTRSVVACGLDAQTRELFEQRLTPGPGRGGRVDRGASGHRSGVHGDGRGHRFTLPT